VRGEGPSWEYPPCHRHCPSQAACGIRVLALGTMAISDTCDYIYIHLFKLGCWSQFFHFSAKCLLCRSPWFHSSRCPKPELQVRYRQTGLWMRRLCRIIIDNAQWLQDTHEPPRLPCRSFSLYCVRPEQRGEILTVPFESSFNSRPPAFATRKNPPACHSLVSQNFSPFSQLLLPHVSHRILGHSLLTSRTTVSHLVHSHHCVTAAEAAAMDDSERRTVKRSRFDQTEPEPRRSRFDRRSRSPPARKPDGRDRSPLRKDGNGDGPSEPKRGSAVDAAAAAGVHASSPRLFSRSLSSRARAPWLCPNVRSGC
jgi:hypothetical protein